MLRRTVRLLRALEREEDGEVENGREPGGELYLWSYFSTRTRTTGPILHGMETIFLCPVQPIRTAQRF